MNFWQKYVLLFFGQNLWIYPKIVFCIIVRLIDDYNSLDDIASYFLNLPLQKHILLFFGQNLWIYPQIVFCITVRLIDGYNSLENKDYDGNPKIYERKRRFDYKCFLKR